MTKQEFYDIWLSKFGSDIPKAKINKYVEKTGNYIWHIFSWGLIPEEKYYSGNRAKIEYDSIDKSGAWYIEWFEDDRAHQIIPKLKTAKDLDEFIEIYVMAKDFSWTYIKTHEDSCGPYFMKM